MCSHYNLFLLFLGFPLLVYFLCFLLHMARSFNHHALRPTYHIHTPYIIRPSESAYELVVTVIIVTTSYTAPPRRLIAAHMESELFPPNAWTIAPAHWPL